MIEPIHRPIGAIFKTVQQSRIISMSVNIYLHERWGDLTLQLLILELEQTDIIKIRTS